MKSTIHFFGSLLATYVIIVILVTFVIKDNFDLSAVKAVAKMAEVIFASCFIGSFIGIFAVIENESKKY